MFINSQNISLFLKRISLFAHKIMREEMKISFSRKYFFYENQYHYLHFACFEDKKTLAYFEASSKLIAVSKNLMFEAKDSVIKDILRHELAHYIAHILYPRATEIHGVEFRSVCRQFGWDHDSVLRAKMNVQNENERKEGELQKERIINKIEKMLALAKSSNPHEAMLAASKVNDLLYKHNLQSYLAHKMASSEAQAGQAEEEMVAYNERVIEAPKRNTKMIAISSILKEFFVYPVTSRGEGVTYLEVTGSKENVEMAVYMGKFLEREFEFLWDQERLQNRYLKGKVAKNSFFTGLASGYIQKIKETRRTTPPSKEQKLALVKIENALDAMVKLIYGGLSSIHSQASYCSASHQLGLQRGKEMNINKGLYGGMKGQVLLQ
jgi:predicted SprT family Zn-dependent metalloprotease